MKPPIPASLKRRLVPIWNRSHHLARAGREYLGAILAGRVENCSVCGRRGLMLYRPRVIPPRLRELWGLTPRLAAALARKESLDCSRCGAKLRARKLADVLLDLYPTEPPSRSIAEWVESPAIRRLRTAEINRVDGLHDALGRLPAHAFSDFVDGARPGETVDGVRHEDLTRLTYPDASFDLIVTSETLEHVPDLAAALAEIRRVLAPGGRHVFTIPMLPGVERTRSRMTLDASGNRVLHETYIAHPGGDVGYPVFTEFGADVLEILDRAGFDARMRFGPPTEDDLGQVFETTRR